VGHVFYFALSRLLGVTWKLALEVIESWNNVLIYTYITATSIMTLMIDVISIVIMIASGMESCR